MIFRPFRFKFRDLDSDDLMLRDHFGDAAQGVEVEGVWAFVSGLLGPLLEYVAVDVHIDGAFRDRRAQPRWQLAACSDVIQPAIVDQFLFVRVQVARTDEYDIEQRKATAEPAVPHAGRS